MDYEGKPKSIDEVMASVRETRRRLELEENVSEEPREYVGNRRQFEVHGVTVTLKDFGDGRYQIDF